MVILFVGILFSLAVAGAVAQAGDGAPPDFPRFEFAGHEAEARTLSDYLWYHFHHRAANNAVLFNKEYLAVADLWMAGAVDPARGKTIQEVHREDIGGVRIHEDGYVDTQQHFSHANDYGWPFPLWTQSGANPDQVRGVTVGWHFQTKAEGGAWIYGFLFGWKHPEYIGETATHGWELHNLRSLGLVDEKWRLEATAVSPALTTPDGFGIDSFNAPYLHLRWTRSGAPTTGMLPYVEWERDGDTEFGPDRRVYFDLGDPHWQHLYGTRNSIIPMFSHPLWKGHIRRVRLYLAPGESSVTLNIDSLFTCYDTRHTINNPIFVLSAWRYFCWTGDIAFLRENIGRMRTAVRYQQTVLGGVAHDGIRNEWPGHDGLPGWVRKSDGSKEIHPGHGIGSNYWDILPFGWDDMYATNQYYASLLAMADAEAAAARHPEWAIPIGGDALDAGALRHYAERVRQATNRRFWDGAAGRFVACIDKDGKRHDFGYTFLNLDAIWYGTASPQHARRIMDWIDGRRIVAGDTSTGADIYRWRFGPRATTKRNIEWYSQGWTGPETIAWGGQVQDGGAVLGFSLFDLWARLHVLGPEDAWKRLAALLEWQREVDAAGGYRAYYKDGSRGTTLQGGGTAGGVGIDAEFYESSLVPSIVTYGFLGINPKADALEVRPNLPASCPEMAVRGLLYHNTRLDIRASRGRVAVTLLEEAPDPVNIAFAGQWVTDGRAPACRFSLTHRGTVSFVREK